MALTDAERVFVEALRTVRSKLMDTITGLDDTIAEVEQAAAVRVDPTRRVDMAPVCAGRGGCGHKHPVDAPHADHQWRDSCPYVGTNCPT